MIYIFFRSFTDLLAIVLILIGISLFLLKDLIKNKNGKIGWWIIFFSFLFMYLFSITPVINPIAYLIEKNCIENNLNDFSRIDIVVVLGGGIIKTGENKFLLTTESSARLLMGEKVLKQSKAKYIVLSGSGSDEAAEAETMAEALMKNGVDNSRIIIENKSINTWENAEKVSNIIKDKNMVIGLVTSASHMHRSMKIFRKFFPNIKIIPSDFIYSHKKISILSFIPKTNNLYNFNKIVHEIIGLFWYNLKIQNSF